MTTVTLSWEDPEDAAQFLRIRQQYRDHGWLTDPDAAALRDLVGSSVVTDGSEEEGEQDD